MCLPAWQFREYTTKSDLEDTVTRPHQSFDWYHTRMSCCQVVRLAITAASITYYTGQNPSSQLIVVHFSQEIPHLL